MQCPACGRKLTSIPLPEGHFPVDGRILACVDGCAGVWLDSATIGLIDAEDKPDLGLLTLIPDPALPDQDDSPRKCPRCPRFTLRKRFYTKQRQVQVDTCDSCGGLWLDHGELARVRALQPVVREKQEKFNEMIRARNRGQGLQSPLKKPAADHGGTMSSLDGLGMFDDGLDLD